MRGKKEPISLYFHFPFCRAKCPYCHFAVFPDRPQWKDRFLNALFLEWDHLAPRVRHRPILSIYFGGGTPTLFPEGIAAVLNKVRHSACVANPCEVTVEANPESFTSATAAMLHQAGVNRLSFGIQSFDPALLRLLGRKATAAQGKEAIQCAATAGFRSISLDLMYEIPYQTMASWTSTLRALRDLPINHLSLYNLTFEPHTPFKKKEALLKPHLPSEDLALALLNQGIAAFEALGLNQYEISAFSHPGSSSIHNSGYWEGRPFFGLGPSAFSYHQGKRWRNLASLPHYVQAIEKGRSPVDFEERLPYPANVCELFAIGLRLVKGVDLALFEKKFGPLPPTVTTTLDKLAATNWLTQARGVVQLTQQGRLFYDSIAEALIV